MMRKTGKLLILFSAFWASQVVLAETQSRVINYSDLLNTLTQGNEVRAVIDFSKCSLLPDNRMVNNTIGGLNFTNFNKYALPINGQLKNVIATSITMLVENPEGTAVYNYVRLRVFEDNSVEILSELRDPKSYTQISQTKFDCHVSNGKDQNGVALYNLSK